MKTNKGSGGKKLEKFFAGKGFYIVLFLCAAVIGVSAWTLMSGRKTVADTDTGVVSNEVAEQYSYPEDNTVLEQAPESDETLWEVPEDAEEVLALPEPPEIVSEEASVPEEEPQAGVETVQEPAERVFIRPVTGEIEMPYSVTALMYDNTMADWRTHDGIDIGAALGTPVLAVSDGTVEAVYQDELYGTTVVIDHGDGIKSVYSNLAELPTVYVGDRVSVGDTIGAIGDTALCETGMTWHLHFAMTVNGASVDPNDYIPAV